MATVEQTHEKKAKLEEMVLTAILEPNLFCETILNSPNDPWQAELFDAVADLDRARLGEPTRYNHELLTRFTVRAFHGPGKTHFAAKLMHWFNFTRKARIPCTAPKKASLTGRTWPEFRKILTKANAEYRRLIKVSPEKIVWFGDPDWAAVVESASTPENLAGFHDENLLFIVEEASGVDENMFPVIEGALSTGNCILFMIGNPTRTKGEFYNSHNKSGTKELYYKKHIQLHEAPRISKKWVEGMVKKYGKNSPIVKVRVFGEFVDAEENQLLHQAWIDDAFNREMDDGSIPKLRLSIDVADGGIDESIITVGKMYQSYVEVLKVKRFSFEAKTAQTELRKAAIRMFEAYGGDMSEDDFVVDSIGVGAGLTSELISLGYNVVRFKGGEKSDDPSRWRNQRVQIYFMLKEAYHDGLICYEENAVDEEDKDDYLAQLISIKTKPGIEKLEDLETKQELKAQGIKSPDMADSTAMLYASKQSERLDADGFIGVETMETSHNEW
jgi:hypothetical protein